eukprot:CAMPEP_0202365858 /NCGR_PEP_ID=MMETSP1126-20121109/16712_1 /ASSEMBLY_ACC=CAM_ASM_000457 /TAXON_ID=3047 /ORGANISM="Dunaliella tertiolecta, Strain CCMP1320" /LENGTH=173 /DNA_ID=CAMNT_0048960813 /DNA_START=48 /DNA_END=569 /DNA_ORIENTATION=-
MPPKRARLLMGPTASECTSDVEKQGMRGAAAVCSCPVLLHQVQRKNGAVAASGGYLGRSAERGPGSAALPEEGWVESGDLRPEVGASWPLMSSRPASCTPDLLTIMPLLRHHNSLAAQATKTNRQPRELDSIRASTDDPGPWSSPIEVSEHISSESRVSAAVDATAGSMAAPG